MKQNINPDDYKIMADLVNMARHNIDDVANKSVATALYVTNEIDGPYDNYFKNRTLCKFEAARHTFKKLNERILHDTWHSEETCISRYLSECSDPDFISMLNRYKSKLIFYCTMEPCTKRIKHSQNTYHRDCCTEIIECYSVGNKKVIIASKDNWYGGDGVKKLEYAGIEVEYIKGFEKELEEINRNNCIEKEVAEEYLSKLEQMKAESIENHKNLVEAKQARIRK